MTGKQRAYLRSMCNTLPAIILVGKEGVTDSLTHSVEEALLLSQRVVMLDRKGRIIEDVENTIPVEERGEGLMLQPEYIRLREHLDSIVHASNE